MKSLVKLISLLLLCSTWGWCAPPPGATHLFIPSPPAMQRFHSSYLPVSGINLEGYWQADSVKAAYLNSYGIGLVYYFIVDASDSNRAAIDIPFWKHWGTQGNWYMTAETHSTLTTIFIDVDLYGLNAMGDTVHIQQVFDGGGGWNTATTHAHYDTLGFRDPRFNWERLLLTIDGDYTLGNPDTCDVYFQMILPFSQTYYETLKCDELQIEY